MSELAVPTAARLQRPRWRDARLVVGLLLVLVSVVLGSLVVESLDDRVPMYAARGALVPGQQLTEGDLVAVDVQLGSQRERYLSAAARARPRPVRAARRSVTASSCRPPPWAAGTRWACRR